MFINNFDPVAFNISYIEIRWYSLAYIFGIILGWIYIKVNYLKQKNSKTKLIVWFDAIMQGVSVEIDPTWLTPVRLQKNISAIAHV